MRDPDLVFKAQMAATALERAWRRWRAEHGLDADSLPAVSSYVGYSLEEPWGQPRVVFGLAADDAERLAALLNGHKFVAGTTAAGAQAPPSAGPLPVPPQAPSIAAEQAGIRRPGPGARHEFERRATERPGSERPGSERQVPERSRPERRPRPDGGGIAGPAAAPGARRRSGPDALDADPVAVRPPRDIPDGPVFRQVLAAIQEASARRAGSGAPAPGGPEPRESAAQVPGPESPGSEAPGNDLPGSEATAPPMPGSLAGPEATGTPASDPAAPGQTGVSDPVTALPGSGMGPALAAAPVLSAGTDAGTAAVAAVASGGTGADVLAEPRAGAGQSGSVDVASGETEMAGAPVAGSTGSASRQAASRSAGDDQARTRRREEVLLDGGGVLPDRDAESMPNDPADGTDDRGYLGDEAGQQVTETERTAGSHRAQIGEPLVPSGELAAEQAMRSRRGRHGQPDDDDDLTPWPEQSPAASAAEAGSGRRARPVRSTRSYFSRYLVVMSCLIVSVSFARSSM